MMILIDSMKSNEFWMRIWRVEECMLLFCQVLGEGSPTSSSFRMLILLINCKAIIWDLGSEAFRTLLGEDDYCIICIRKVKERPLKELAELARNPPRPMTAISRRLAKSKNLDTPRRQQDPKGGNAMEMRIATIAHKIQGLRWAANWSITPWLATQNHETQCLGPDSGR